MARERLLDLEDGKVENVSLATVVSGESLGARLKRQKMEREQAVTDKENAKEDKRRERIVAWFEKIKQSLQKAVDENKDIRPATVPDYVTNQIAIDNRATIITNPKHKDYHLWVQFCIWCQENDVVATLDWNNNAGYYGSYMLTIVPSGDT